jgi:hypothetical protein
MKSRVFQITLAAAVLVLFCAVPAWADVVISVGYADNLRPSGFFPTPWIGDPNTVAAESGAQSFDSGAVKIDNTGALPITITNMMVTLNSGTGPIAFTIWGALVIPAGESGIYAQTFSYNLDTSDSPFLPGGIGIDAGHPLGGCTNPGALNATQLNDCTIDAPVVAFTVDGLTNVSAVDTGNILNTFGYDFVCCSSDGNESINWNLIGTSPIRGGSVPEPSTITLFGSGLLACFTLLRRKMRKS